ncbi:hypothetical protein NEHOM01_2468 [Nematocida homosporus]|uniref:uncharacterized protein n=1 Tax=Nematocida homosporus TaxID=1912981 RepID=UPI00221E95AF|nr:uncharacterized protein NEHOM01_2468 [Nematocida homosporus]KAI5187973.1 hypothetical protein NEHOM01_2468 [Nematocida homosporus]
MSSNIKRTSIILIAVGLACILLAAWAGYVLCQMYFTNSLPFGLFKRQQPPLQASNNTQQPPLHPMLQQEPDNAQPAPLQPMVQQAPGNAQQAPDSAQQQSICDEDTNILETSNEKTLQSYYQLGLSGNMFAQEIVENAMADLLNQQASSIDSAHIYNKVLFNMILKPCLTYNVEKVDSVASISSWLHKAAFDNLIFEKEFPGKNDQDGRWARIISYFARPYQWMCQSLSTSKLDEINKKVAAYESSSNNNPLQKNKDRQDITKEIIQNVSMAVNLGGFADRCHKLRSKLFDYRDKQNLSNLEDDTIPIESLLFLLDWISYLVPLQPSHLDKINKILDEADIAVNALEQKPSKLLTTKAYMAYFSTVSKKILDEVNCVLALLKNIHGFFESLKGNFALKLQKQIDYSYKVNTALELLDLTLDLETNIERILDLVECYEATFPLWMIYLGLVIGCSLNQDPAPSI